MATERGEEEEEDHRMEEWSVIEDMDTCEVN